MKRISCLFVLAIALSAIAQPSFADDPPAYRAVEPPDYLTEAAAPAPPPAVSAGCTCVAGCPKGDKCTCGPSCSCKECQFATVAAYGDVYNRVAAGEKLTIAHGVKAVAGQLIVDIPGAAGEWKPGVYDCFLKNGTPHFSRRADPAPLPAAAPTVVKTWLDPASGCTYRQFSDGSVQRTCPFQKQ